MSLKTDMGSEFQINFFLIGRTTTPNPTKGTEKGRNSGIG